MRSTVGRLIDIATQDSSQSEVMPVASIHALNILRVLVMDGGLTTFMAPYLGLLLELTISKFRSRFWGLRNVSMMLFSSLSIKIFGSRNTNKDTKEARMPIDEFFAAYPNLDAFLRSVLSETRTEDMDSDDGAESSLFAVVMLFSRMQAPEDEPKRSDEAERMQAYRALLSACLANKVWKVREVAAKAYSAFVPLRSAAQHAVRILATIGLHSQNEAHGKLVLLQRLLKSVADASASTSAMAKDVAALSESLAENASKLLERNLCAITQAAFVEVVQDLIGIRDAAFLDTAGHLVRVVTVWTSMLFADVERADVLEKVARSAGGPALLGVCTRFHLQVAAQGQNPDSFVHVCMQHVSCASQDVRIACLEALIGDDGIAALQQSSLRQPERVASFVRKLHATTQDEDEGIWHRVDSAEILHQIAAQRDAEGASWLKRAFVDDAIVSETASIARIVSSTVCVPLREALLPYFSHLCKLLLDRATLLDGTERMLQQWSWAVTRCADEYASVQSREAACAALRVLGAILFPASSSRLVTEEVTESALFKARIAAIDLLTDDDEEVRAEAAAMIGETISAATEIRNAAGAQVTRCEAMQQMARRGGASPDVSTDRAWTWMAVFYSPGETSASANLWEEYVVEQLMPSSAAMEELFEETFASNTLLFAEEKPNQFRDPEATIRRAARFVKLGWLEPMQREEMEERTTRSLVRLDQALASDAKYDAVTMHMLAVRLLLTQRILAQGAGASTEAERAAESIASSLGIDVPSLGSPASSKADLTQESNDDQDASAQPRYNIA